MTETGYTKTIKPVRDWSQRIWRLMFTQRSRSRGGASKARSQSLSPGR